MAAAPETGIEVHRDRTPGRSAALIFEQVYGQQGAFSYLMEVVLHEGTESREGRLFLFQRIMPNRPRDSIRIAAKVGGALCVERGITAAPDDRIVQPEYSMVLPSGYDLARSEFRRYRPVPELYCAGIAIKQAVIIVPDDLTGFVQGLNTVVNDVGLVAERQPSATCTTQIIPDLA